MAGRYPHWYREQKRVEFTQDQILKDRQNSRYHWTARIIVVSIITAIVYLLSIIPRN